MKKHALNQIMLRLPKKGERRSKKCILHENDHDKIQKSSGIINASILKAFRYYIMYQTPSFMFFFHQNIKKKLFSKNNENQENDQKKTLRSEIIFFFKKPKKTFFLE